MIELVNLTKSYRTNKGRHYVFRNLNFRFPEGTSVGLMGRNGAGKSTLMRLIGGIDTPDSGRVITNKRISWTVGLGSGFQGSLSPRDNVRFVARLYSASPEETLEKIRFVEDFSDIGKFFDIPMKACSSGMRGRVSFGLSMAFDFDYYLIDESMATGDPLFRKKAKAVFRERVANANLILVSHNQNDIREWCDVVVVVEGGEATLFEDVEEGLKVYQNMQRQAQPVPTP
jgi:capsular polysaccharide transport system ATP-binding protein